MWKLLSNLTVDDLNKVPEDLRGLYVEDNGKFTIPEANRGAAKVVDGLGGALSKVRGELDTAKKSAPNLAPWKALASKVGLEEDAEPEAIAEAIDALAKDKGNKNVADEVAKVKKSMTEGFAKQIKAKDDEIQVMTGTLSKHLIENEANAAFAELKGAGALLLPHVLRQTKMVKEGSEWMPRVVDSDGNVVLGADGSPLPVKGLIKNMKADTAFARAFDSESPAGGGAKPGAAARPLSTNGGQLAAASPVSKIAAGLRNSPSGTKGL